MSIVELNIGLGTDVSRVANRVARITTWLSYRTRCTSPVFHMRVFNRSDDEYVLAARVSFAASNVLEAFETLARELREDCIAVWDVDTRTGYLIGPKRLDWGDFDIKKFVRMKS